MHLQTHAPPLMKIWQYGILKVAMRSKYTAKYSTWNCHRRIPPYHNTILVFLHPHVLVCAMVLQVCSCGCPHKEVYEQHLRGKKHLRVRTYIYVVWICLPLCSHLFHFYTQNTSIVSRKQGTCMRENMHSITIASVYQKRLATSFPAHL